MGDFLLGFEKLASTTWYYLASLLVIGLFFKFNRFWSVRNADLILLILLAPGVILVTQGRNARMDFIREYPQSALQESQDPSTETSNSVPTSQAVNDDPHLASGNDSRPFVSGDQLLVEKRAATKTPALSRFMEFSQFRRAVAIERNGFIWLFFFGLVLMFRMLLDSGFVRRPLLEPNLTVAGLVFLGISLLVILLSDVARNPPEQDKSGAKRALQIAKGEAVHEDADTYNQHGPGYALMHILPAIPTFVEPDGTITGPASTETAAGNFQLEFITKAMAIISQLFIVVAIVLVGHRHFNNLNLGMSVATLYLMLPYTADMAGRVFHLLPALLLVWAVVCYRNPYFAGGFIGLAAGVFYYPMFLLPLWISFYWDRGRYRFLFGFLFAFLIVVSSLVFVSQDSDDFFRQLRLIFGFWLPKVTDVRGIWALGWDPWFRLPFLVGFFGLCFSFAFWPTRKNLGTLISCTAAIMLALQFCHGFGGGTFISWYLPLVLITFFRPNLEERNAESDVAKKLFSTSPTGTATNKPATDN